MTTGTLEPHPPKVIVLEELPPAGDCVSPPPHDNEDPICFNC